jgi:tetratricopeptide (TPR) repeat protein
MELKGVNEAIEVFDVILEGDIQSVSSGASNFFKNLWDRRVFQVAGIYIAGSWIIKQAVATVVTRYFLSPHITGLAWVILLSLLPSVILITYYHGRRKKNQWTQAELIGLPANLVLTIVVLVIMFRGKDLGAATQAVVVETEDGERIERMVVKSEFRKKIALFNLESTDNDSTIAYLQYSIPTMIEYDLGQDFFIESMSSVRFFDKMRDAGYPSGVGLPISVMKKLTNNYHLNYFLSGSIVFKEGQYTIKTKLYEAEYGKLIAENTFSGPDYFMLVDEISVSIKEGVGIPNNHIVQSYDLPIADIFTGSDKALQLFSQANKDMIFKDFGSAMKNLELAVDEDKGFAIAYLSLANVCFNSNQVEKAKLALDNAMQHIDKVPERSQFFIKFFYYLLQQQADKALAVIKMWTELYPEDIEAHTMLAQRLQMADDIHGAIKEYQLILSLDPEQYEFLNFIGDLYQKIGESDSALYYFEKYAEKFPKNYRSYENIGDHYKTIADFEKAKEYYEKAILLEPARIDIPLALAVVELRVGEFDKVIASYEQLLANARSAEDSASVLASMSTYYSVTGQADKSLEANQQMVEIYKKTMPMLRVLVQQVFQIEKYIIAGEKEEAFSLLAQIESEFEPPLDKVAAFGYLFGYIETGEDEKAESYVPIATELAKVFGEEMLLSNVNYGMARIYQLREEYENAIEYYQLFLEKNPTNYPMHAYMSECYRGLKDYDKAEESIQLALKHYPYRPTILFKASKLYFDLGKDEKAMEYLQLANDIWKDADVDYKSANEAKVLLNEMQAGA